MDSIALVGEDVRAQWLGEKRRRESNNRHSHHREEGEGTQSAGGGEEPCVMGATWCQCTGSDGELPSDTKYF